MENGLQNGLKCILRDRFKKNSGEYPKPPPAWFKPLSFSAPPPPPPPLDIGLYQTLSYVHSTWNLDFFFVSNTYGVLALFNQ